MHYYFIYRLYFLTRYKFLISHYYGNICILTGDENLKAVNADVTESRHVVHPKSIIKCQRSIDSILSFCLDAAKTSGSRKLPRQLQCKQHTRQLQTTIFYAK